ncbi:hypothetical protein CUMW_274040 [Citrus unshiu]|uniref:Uncharacterized protein n=1 Tax=Citrus unshiu TaxID=55188 RepID=A0A2H5MX92_CITUN|nr:hypothetical protein CUMW_274040 [Citrus unshiu]
MGLHSKTDLKLISTRGIWEIMGQYFPSSFLHLSSINGQPLIRSCKSDLGRPCSGKYLSFGQSMRYRSSNEVRLCMQLGKAFRFSQFQIVR